MGCGQSEEAREVRHITYENSQSGKKPIITMIGSTVKGSMILNFFEDLIESKKCNTLLPKYANSILKNNEVGFLTGGIE